MANNENLKKGEATRFRAGEEQVERARKAGVASGAARRQKSNMKKAAQMLLSMPIAASQEKTRSLMESLGIQEEDMVYGMSILVALLAKANKGDVNAARVLIKELDGLGMFSNDPDDPMDGQEETEQVMIYLPDNGRGDNPGAKVVDQTKRTAKRTATKKSGSTSAKKTKSTAKNKEGAPSK